MSGAIKNNKKKVVIVGCGYAGSATALGLDKHASAKGSIELTVITKREGFLLNKYSALRAAAADAKWVDRTLIPLGKMLKHGQIIQGAVVAVSREEKCVILENGEKIQYDVLCLATGTRNFSPAEPPSKITSKEATEAHFKAMHSALSSAKSIAIVGSGPVSYELAGEIKSAGQKDVKITLVTRSEHVLHGKTPLTKSNQASLERLLAQEHVDVIFQDEVASEPVPEDLEDSSPIVHTPNGITLKSGKQIKCDLLVYTVGSFPSTGFVPAEWLDPKTREIIVDEKTLLVKGTENVFCVGDAAKINYTKLGYFATEDGKIAAKNILDVVNGKHPKHSISRSPLMLAVAFGPKKGRIITPWGNLGNWSTSSFKSSGLYTQLMWGMVAPGLKRPDL